MNKIFDLLKQASKERGYELFYNKSLGLWSLSKPDAETEYFPKDIFKIIHVQKFIEAYMLD